MTKKLIVILLAVLLLAIYLIACLLGPISYRGERQTTIAGSYPLVYLFINDIKEWPKWYSWDKLDPSLKYKAGAREVNIGANFAFDGKKFGKGYAELIASEKDSFLTASLVNSNLPSEMIMNWDIKAQGNQFVYVKSSLRLKKPIPFFKRAFYHGFKSEMDLMLQQDLDGLKNYIEKLVNTDFGIKQEQFKEKKYFGVLEIVLASKLPSFYARVYPKIYKYLDSLKVIPTGPPVNLTYDWEGKSGYVQAMAALPVDKYVKPGLGFEFVDVPTNDCLKLEHFGPYSTLRNAHARLDYIFRRNNQVIDRPIIEEYVTSPSQQPDTSKWQTNIYYMIYRPKPGEKSLVNKSRTIDDLNKEFEERRRQELEYFNRTRR